MPASNQTGRRHCAAPSCTRPVHRHVALHALTVAGWLPRWCLPAASAGPAGFVLGRRQGPAQPPCDDELARPGQPLAGVIAARAWADAASDAPSSVPPSPARPGREPGRDPMS